MNGYVFYTFEGSTESPTGKECENIQLLGFEYGKNKTAAKDELIATREWIKELDFDTEEIEAKQLLTEENKKDIKTLVDYLWKDEEKHFEETGSSDKENHIFSVLRRLKELVV